MSRWLLVGAMGPEVLPILWRLERPRPLDRRLVLGRLAGLEVGILRCGVGPAKAERRTRRALEAWEADRVLSLGTCGALHDDLAIGRVVTADRLFEDARPCRELQPLEGHAVRGCTTVTRPVEHPDVRRRLAVAGAGICDMEAAAVARAAGPRAFAVLKVVSDLAGAEPDPALLSSRRLRIARFRVRALRLSRDHLADAVCRALAG